MNDPKQFPADYKFDPETGKPILHLAPIEKRDRVYPYVCAALCLLAANFTLFGGFAAGFSIAFILLAVCALLFLGDRLHYRPFNLICLLSAFVVSASFSIYPNSAFSFFKLWFLALAVSVFFMDACGLRAPVLCDWRAAFAPFYLLAVGGGNISYTARSLGRGQVRFGKKFSKILLGILIALPALAVLLALLQRADAAFESLVSSLHIRFGEIIATVLFGGLLFLFLFCMLFALRKRHTNERPGSQKAYASFCDPTVANTILVAVSILYAIYLLSQIGYFFGGFKGELPVAYTFAEYARRGFGEMCAVSVINLILIFFAHLLVRRKEEVLPALTRALLFFISFFSILLIAAAIAKMLLYIGQYGLTFLRLGTSVFMLFLFFVFLAVILRLFRAHFPYMRMIVVAACLIMAVSSLADIESAAAHYNFYAYQNGVHDSIDVAYLGDCQDSAVPLLVELAHGEDQALAEDAYRELFWILRTHADIRYDGTIQEWKHRDIRSIHVAYVNADRLLRQYAGEILQHSQDLR